MAGTAVALASSRAPEYPHSATRQGDETHTVSRNGWAALSAVTRQIRLLLVEHGPRKGG
ncbi:MAG TPA: hypothetical protein VF960_11360 [Chloroflexota bacterium]